MSGFEVGGIALGAIPIILEAIKGYREAYNHVQTFKHAKKQLSLIGGQFQVCRMNFQNECRLLLDLILFDSQLSNEMISDPQHRLWQEPATRKQMTDLLKNNADACTAIVADTHATVVNFTTRLFKLQTSTGNSSKSSLQRARTSATFMMEKSRFERDIEILRQRNADLNLMREQIASLGPRTRTVHTNATLVSSSKVVKRFSQIRFASRYLHDTLKTSWSCFDQTHLSHWVKLSVEPGLESENLPDSVSLDMAISSETSSQAALQNTTTWLLVRSESKTLMSQATPDPLESLVQSLQLSSNSRTPSAMSASQTTTTQTPLTSPATSMIPPATTGIDICTVACVCSHLQKHACNLHRGQQPNYLGYLKSPNDARYLFYCPSNPRVSTTSANTMEEVTTLISVIEKSQRASLELLHQYNLALKIAIGVLQFHNTAWLSPIWGLDNISIFGSKLSDDTLKSLHLSTSFERTTTAGNIARIQGSAATNPTNTMSPTTTSVQKGGNSRCPSIYNETLFSLGIALLEIAHWKSFQVLTQNDPDEVRAAHRLVRGPAPLGPKFRKIVERCIRCDFEAGSEDLEDASLQHAVWSKAVYPLESLIRDTSQVV